MSKPKTQSKLIKAADTYFSKYIRLRDSEVFGDQWKGTCISCGKPFVVCFRDEETGKWRWTHKVNAGHFISRGHKIVRFEEENVNLQCVGCNKWKSGNVTPYEFALEEKYGEEVPQKLREMVRKNPVYKHSRDDLEQIIKDSKKQVEYYLSQA